MNKKLIALAIAGATVAPAAMAQTANPVTLYGRVYLTLESVEAKGDPRVARRTRIQDQASLLGVRGTEDLGGGLKAFFQLETAFNPESASGTFANRNSGIGLQGGWGSFLMGRWDMPFKTTTIAIDPYGDLTIGGITTALNRGHDAVTFDRRDPNVLQYWSPNFAGFAFRVAYQVKDTSSTAAHDQGASLTYTRGPVYLVAAYEEHKDQAFGGDEDGIALGGSFKAGAFKFGLLGEQFKRDGRSKKKSWLANIVWTLGNHQFIYQYQQAKDGGIEGDEQPDCKAHQPGYQYNFSRRTFFLAQYTKVDNNSTSKCGDNVVNGVVNGSDPQGFSVGLRHVF